MQTFSHLCLFYLIFIRISYIHLFLFLFHLLFGFNYHFVRIPEYSCLCLLPLAASLRFLHFRKILGLDLGQPTTVQVLHILNFFAPLHSWRSCPTNQLVLNSFFYLLDLLCRATLHLNLLGLFIFLSFFLIWTQNSIQMKILFRFFNFVIILIKIMALH